MTQQEFNVLVLEILGVLANDLLERSYRHEQQVRLKGVLVQIEGLTTQLPTKETTHAEV